jgi:rSAM/selenodomain-associated transferase 2
MCGVAACYLAPVRLSVVIPALDEANRVAGAVASARAEGVEVLVVDGGSRDATPERARAAGARVLSSPPGRARQLSIGAQEARGDVLLFLHADTRLPPGWHAAVRGALCDPDAVGGAFRLRFDERSPALRLVEWGAWLRVALLGLPYGDQAVFVRRTALERSGGVPQVAFLEDLDLVRQLKRQGRLVRLSLPATTSARRYRDAGVGRTALRNLVVACAWALGLSRDRVAAWYRR